jgi:metal-sulfur cluster biosynthetic enzyme
VKTKLVVGVPIESQNPTDLDNVDPSGAVGIQMTLTSPNCPSAQELPVEVETKARAVPGVAEAKVEVVFDPPWDPSKMSEAAKLAFGIM